ncbi:MAG: MBOAT family protein [Oscillospiraceae bacterium]|nr:MBOAT family protein [Oscillospiraceae bacterium]MBQ9939425.1 MBOAT family protein [Oscillospiraceae bacterium]
MIFSDLFFIYAFLPITLVFYFISKDIRWRNAVLLVFSLIFYAWGEPVWIVLLIFSATMDYFLGRVIGNNIGKPAAKIALTVSIVMNLSMLGVFKYTGFIVENINAITGAQIEAPEIALPIGISFYVFRTISYTIDCYWEKIEPEKKYFRYLLFLSMFPQVLMGPIVRYETIGEQLAERKTTAEDLSNGAMRIILGIAKKVIIANNLSTIIGDMLRNDVSTFSIFGTWYFVLIYALQIYFDFSGYSDIAIGLGRIFGFRFLENFEHPFMSKTISEYWQRWHISLGTFFRDYLLYVPIFGRTRKYFGLFLVWFCTGLWHGASWNYIIWGLYFGLFVLIENLIGKKRMKKIPSWIKHIYTKIVVLVGFGIFYFEDSSMLGNFFKNLVGANGNALYDQIAGRSFMENIFLIVAAVLFSFPLVEWVGKKLPKNRKTAVITRTASIVCCIALLIVSSIMLVNTTDSPFLYLQW